jgi:hypothetical protein
VLTEQSKLSGRAEFCGGGNNDLEHDAAHDEDLLSSEVCREKLHHCKSRHPDLNDALARLQTTLQQALCRELQVTPNKRVLRVAVFGLAHQAADDFFDVVLLATHGYGIGAQKLLRPLYERVVSALYLIERPEEVQDFNDYIDIDAWQVITNAKGVGVDPVSFMGQQQYDQAEQAYKAAQARFTRPGSKRARPSWAQKDLLRRGAEVKVVSIAGESVGLDKLYGACGFWPTMLLHTTNVSLEARLTSTATGGRALTHEPTRAEADTALKCAHDLIVLLLHKCNEFFGWGLDVTPLTQDVVRCWGGGTRR